MEGEIIFILIVSVALLIWFLISYNKSQVKKERDPYSQMAYNEELARQEAKRDYRNTKLQEARNNKWKKNLNKNILRSWEW